MRHYVVVFLESRLFPGTWVTDHFVRREEREDVPHLPETLVSSKHPLALKLLRAWQNEPPPEPSWTLEECLIGGVACFTAIWYGGKEALAKRIVRYHIAVPPNALPMQQEEATLCP